MHLKIIVSIFKSHTIYSNWLCTLKKLKMSKLKPWINFEVQPVDKFQNVHKLQK